MLIARQCTPHFLFNLAKQKKGSARSKRKESFGGSVCASADLLPPAGEGWHSLVEVRDGTALPLGKSLARGGLGYPLLLFSLPLTFPQGTARGSEKRSRDHASTTPTTSAPSATGRQSQESQKRIACPKVRPNRRLHRYAAPRRAEGHCTGARQRFSLWTVHGPFLFWHDKREMGGASPLDKPPAGADPLPAAVRRPLPTQQRVHLPSHPNNRISPAADSRPISQKRKDHAPCRTSSNSWQLN